MNLDQIAALFPGWKVMETLGRGAFGEVFRIERVQFGHKEEAAIKHIRIPGSPDVLIEMEAAGYPPAAIEGLLEQDLQRITGEYYAMKKLKGTSHIVSCDDLKYAHRADGPGWDVYIKMEYLTPMLTWLQTTTMDPVLVALPLGLDICSALVLCQKHGMVHRDIKPENIFISDFGEFKLGDFGVARSMDHTISGATQTGTIPYIAPEIIHGQPYGPSVDTYSLGLVLYLMLNALRLPFYPLPPQIPSAKESSAAQNRRLNGEPLPPPAFGTPLLKNVVLKACAFDPAQRFSSAQEMLDALEAAQEEIKKLINEQKESPSPASGSSSAPVSSPTPKSADSPAPAPEKYVTGIHLGFTNSSVGILTETVCRKLRIPSMMVITRKGDVIYGNPASRYRNSHPEAACFSALDPQFYHPGTFVHRGVSYDHADLIKGFLKALKEAMEENKVSIDTFGLACASGLSLRGKNFLMKCLKETGFSKIDRILDTASACALFVTVRDDYVYATAPDVSNVLVYTRERMKDEELYTVGAFQAGDEILEAASMYDNQKEPVTAFSDLKYELLENHPKCVRYYFSDLDFWKSEKEDLFAQAPGYQAEKAEELSFIACLGCAMYAGHLAGMLRDPLLLDLIGEQLSFNLSAFPEEPATSARIGVPSNTTFPVRTDSITSKSVSGSPFKKSTFLRIYSRGSFRKGGSELLEVIPLGDLLEGASEANVVFDLQNDHKTGTNVLFSVIVSNPVTEQSGSFPVFYYPAANKADQPTDYPAPFSRFFWQVNRTLEHFIHEANNLNLAYTDASRWTGIRMIATRCSGIQKLFPTQDSIADPDFLIDQLLELMETLDYTLVGISALKEDSSDEILLRVYQQLIRDLSSVGIQPIFAEGAFFNPYLHEAVSKEEKPDDSNPPVDDSGILLVSAEIQKGFLRDGKLLRPSKVKVNV